MDEQNCELINLPLYHLSDSEFNSLIGNWHNVFNSDVDLYNVIQNLDKFDERFRCFFKYS